MKFMLLLCPLIPKAQSGYLEASTTNLHFLERLEIKQQTNSELNFSTLKPLLRKDIVREVEVIDSIYEANRNLSISAKSSMRLTKSDEYNLHTLLLNNRESMTLPLKDFMSKRPILKTFYKTKANLLEVNEKDFFLAANPVFNFSLGKEKTNSERLFINTRGVSVRGMIANKIGFSTVITDNQQRGPRFFQQQITKYGAVPGASFYKRFKETGYDYFDARGSVNFGITKYIKVQFGNDKNFIGNGYRSLFLSDWGSNYLFLKLRTKIWKFDYQNIFMELMPQFVKTRDTLLDRKYAAIHHLSINATKWLNVGLFEGVVLSRKNHFDLQYLNPIIFYRSVEGNVGSPDNAIVGLNLKANIRHRFQIYSQFLLDEFVLSRVKNDPTYWANKWALQLGIKYVDAFGINNLDLQLETNRVRPFTYSHGDTTANFTHYNQPLTHPLGANFQEFIAIVNYQPLSRCFVYAKIITYYKGLDSAGIDFGGNPFEDYRNRTMESGFKVGSGNKATCLNALLRASYELKNNLFVDLSFQYRSYKLIPVTEKTSIFNLGVRLNMAVRDNDF